MITFKQIKTNDKINTYIRKADESLVALGYTEHSFAHVTIVAKTAKYILETLGYPKEDVELAMIAAYLHDIGNLINRIDHAQSGAVMAFKILEEMGASPEEIATVVTAIGNHDEGTAVAVNHVAAALILGDKTDVRRTRVRNTDITSFDIHDRVNYSVNKAEVKILENNSVIRLKISIDTRYCSVMDYFEIFINRMILCRKAAEKLDMQFRLIVNEQQVI